MGVIQEAFAPAGEVTRLVGTGRRRSVDEDLLRWRAVESRDPAADGKFVYAVSSTGVFCRPTCPSRRPRRDRVEFFESPKAARAAGYRACARCHPENGVSSLPSEKVTSACRTIRDAQNMPSLGQLASDAGLSVSHFHRLFRRIMGVTPREYRASLMTEKAKEALRSGDTVTGAMYEAGFSSSGRFYESGAKRMGMIPKHLRDGGKEEIIQFASAPCSLGQVLVAATVRGICEIWLGDKADSLAKRLQTLYPKAEFAPNTRIMSRLVADVVRLVDRPTSGIHLPLDLRGTAFQMRVWAALQKIPLGTTQTYGQIARSLGRPNSARAVGQACARNRVAIVVPCHRAVGADNSLHGYRWGTKRKKALLERERGTV